jgi:hypothetical protein
MRSYQAPASIHTRITAEGSNDGYADSTTRGLQQLRGARGRRVAGMSWKLNSALIQTELDLRAANDADRELIEQARRRLDYRRHAIKVLRRRNELHGLVDLAPNGLTPEWTRADSLSKHARKQMSKQEG